MSKNILRIAHFKVCTDCEQRGYIVFSDGSKGKEVTCELGALLQIQQAKKDGKILDVEIPILHKQISDSPLPTSSVIPKILNMIADMICHSEDDRPKPASEYELAQRISLN